MALQAAAPELIATATEGSEAEPDRLARLLGEQRFLAIPIFFGLGLLLAFTPCVFPMIPILSGLIARARAKSKPESGIGSVAELCAGNGGDLYRGGRIGGAARPERAGMVSDPWVISLFSALFVALALAMFGVYELQLPGDWQQRLTAWSNRQRGGRHAGVAIMGFLSALIVGPCVAPPLIGVLTFIAVTGDMALGAVALFTLSLGMGAPLLLIGASTGHWLPRAGHWMERIEAISGDAADSGVVAAGADFTRRDRHDPVGNPADRDCDVSGRTATAGAWASRPGAL